jgi:hypothetical protein
MAEIMILPPTWVIRENFPLLKILKMPALPALLTAAKTSKSSPALKKGASTDMAASQLTTIISLFLPLRIIGDIE